MAQDSINRALNNMRIELCAEFIETVKSSSFEELCECLEEVSVDLNSGTYNWIFKTPIKEEEENERKRKN